MRLPDMYDIPSAVEGADTFEIVQGIGEAGRESALAVGDLLGGDTGEEIAQTGLDLIDAGMEAAANLVAGLF